MLLDTHVVLWLLDDSPRLGARARAGLRSGDDVQVSAASLWELAVKAGLGKVTVPDDLPDLIAAAGLSLLPVTADHAWSIRDSVLSHRDPFDRMLVAQAGVEGLPFLTADAAILEAAPHLDVEVRDART